MNSFYLIYIRVFDFAHVFLFGIWCDTSHFFFLRLFSGCILRFSSDDVDCVVWVVVSDVGVRVTDIYFFLAIHHQWHYCYFSDWGMMLRSVPPGHQYRNTPVQLWISTFLYSISLGCWLLIVDCWLLGVWLLFWLLVVWLFDVWCLGESLDGFNHGSIIIMVDHLFHTISTPKKWKHTPQEENIDCGGFHDIYCGENYRIARAYFQNNRIGRYFTTINECDGVNPFRSSSFSIWPCLSIINELPYDDRIKPSNMFLRFVFISRGKMHRSWSRIVHRVIQLASLRWRHYSAMNMTIIVVKHHSIDNMQAFTKARPKHFILYCLTEKQLTWPKPKNANMEPIGRGRNFQRVLIGTVDVITTI